ncbi:MAG: cache domain-containing protein [Bryobacteraceae bacterium]
MSIKGKIIAVVAGSLLVGVAVIGYLFDRNYRLQVARTSDETLRASRAAFENLRKDSVDMMAAAVEAMASNQEINAALARRDRAQLLKATSRLYLSYHEKYGITHWFYWEPEPSGQTGANGLVNFLRAATPDKHGDMVERVMLARVAKTKTFANGLEMGITGLAFRVVAPVYWKGKLCGYFEIGKDIGNFLDSMKQQTGNEYGLLLQKSQMDKAKWRSSRASWGKRDNWNDMNGLLLAKNTYSDESILTYGGSLDKVPEAGQELGLVEHGAAVYSRGVFPLYSAGGVKVGAVFVLSDITAVYQSAHQTMVRGLLAIVLLMALTGIVMCVLFNRLIVARLERLIRVAKRVVGGEFNLQVVPSANDELGKFEELFEQFRRVLVDLVGNIEDEAAAPVYRARLRTRPRVFSAARARRVREAGREVSHGTTFRHPVQAGPVHC